MKLHAPDGKFPVLHAHDFALVGFRRDFQAGGQGVALDDERMIARGRKRIGHALEQVQAVVFDERGFAMHHPVVHDHVGAEGVADALVAEADAEQRNLRPERADDFIRETGLARRTRAGRNEDAFGVECAHLLDGDLVVAMHLHVGLQLAEILHEVVGERIVIV